MEKKHDSSNAIGRRRILQVLGVGIGAASGIAVLGGCNKGGSQGAGGSTASKGGSCLDKGDIDDQAANLRKVLQYKDKADTPEKKCSLCAQYEAGKYGSCGGCKLFAGGVQPEGVCLSFAPLAAPGAAPAAAPAAPAPAAPAAPGQPS